MALRQPGEYAIERGRIVSSTGLDIDVSEYEQHFTETHVERSNALHSTLAGVGNYLVGPLARYALNSAGAVAARAGDRRRGGARRRVPQPVPQHRRARRRDGLRGGRGASDHRAVRAARPAGRRGDPARGHGARLQRGAARDLLAPLRDRRRRHDPRREDRAADLAEPEDDRGGPGRRRQAVPAPVRTTSWRTAASRRSATTTPASPARRTSSGSRSNAGESGRVPRQPLSRRRRRRPARRRPAPRGRRRGARLRRRADAAARRLGGPRPRRDRGRGVVGCRRRRARCTASTPGTGRSPASSGSPRRMRSPSRMRSSSGGRSGGRRGAWS